MYGTTMVLPIVDKNAKMSSFGMDACMETFAMLIKFITLMN